MKENQIAQLLNRLAEATAEPVRPALADDIKREIPDRLAPHSVARDTIHILIDLRISKLTAAAAILVAIIVFGGLFYGRDGTNGNIVEDIQCYLGWAGINKSNIETCRSFHECLIDLGKDAVFYGDAIDPKDATAVMVQWKLPDGNYGVIFADLSARTVTPGELVQLLSRMLRKKAKEVVL